MGKELTAFLNDVMRRRRRLPSQMAKELGLSHATVIRWLADDTSGGRHHSIPSPKSCMALAEYSGEPLMKVLAVAGHAVNLQQDNPGNWPAFGDYARRKYPKELSEDLISVVESLIERKKSTMVFKRLSGREA